MGDFTTWAERHSKLDEFQRLVQYGEFECEHNPTMDMRSPLPTTGDSGQKCRNTATHVETIRREFVLGAYIYDVPLCEAHRGWRF